MWQRLRDLIAWSYGLNSSGTILMIALVLSALAISLRTLVIYLRWGEPPAGYP